MGRNFWDNFARGNFSDLVNKNNLWKKSQSCGVTEMPLISCSLLFSFSFFLFAFFRN